MGKDPLPGTIERHPWKPYLPQGTRMIFLGSFPPPRHRWSMDFFYPNYTNDFWRVFGLCLYGDRWRFVDEKNRTFRRLEIEQELQARGIGLYDTAWEVRRTKNTASDKDLEVITPTNLDELLKAAPECLTVVTTGQKATDLFTEHFGISAPRVGNWVEFRFLQRTMRLYRMPSTSRAYPLSLERKADCYRILFENQQHNL